LEARRHEACPVCGALVSLPNRPLIGGVTVGRESDLCPRFRGRQVDGVRHLKAEISMCPNCYFAVRGDFPDVDLTPSERDELAERLASDGLLKVFGGASPARPWLPFHAAEVSGKGRDLPARELGEICLRASWVCRKELDRPFESAFQTRAIRHFIRSLKEDPLPDRTLSVVVYLVGELNRRLGQHREALNWYANAERTMRDGDSGGLTWLGRMIEEQSKLAEAEAA
jgi:uncharacterized protein